MVPKFINLWKMVLPSRTLSTAVKVAGLNEATLDGLVEVTFHAQAIVTFHVPGSFLPPWACSYQLAHCPLCSCLSRFWSLRQLSSNVAQLDELDAMFPYTCA